MTPLIKSTHWWSKFCQNPDQTPLPLSALRNFCSVLQISPKHFTIPQYKSYPVFRGTQLCFWVALPIWSGKWWKTWSTADFTIHRRHENLELCSTFLLRLLIKTPVGLGESCRGVIDLQLCYSSCGAVLFNILEKSAVKQAKGNKDRALPRHARDIAPPERASRAHAPCGAPPPLRLGPAGHAFRRRAPRGRAPRGRTRPKHLGSPRPPRVAPHTRADPCPCWLSFAVLQASTRPVPPRSLLLHGVASAAYKGHDLSHARARTLAADQAPPSRHCRCLAELPLRSRPMPHHHLRLLPRSCWNSSLYALPGERRRSAGLQVTAAAAALLHRASSPRASLPQASAQIEPRWATSPPPHLPCQELRRIPTSLPPPHGQGPHCNTCDLSRVLNVKKGHSCEKLESSRDLSERWNFNSVAILLKLVNSVKNCRKIRKMQTKFCWIPGEKHYNFYKACP
jgi:hypothetical protein